MAEETWTATRRMVSYVRSEVIRARLDEARAERAAEDTWMQPKSRRAVSSRYRNAAAKHYLRAVLLLLKLLGDNARKDGV